MQGHFFPSSLKKSWPRRDPSSKAGEIVVKLVNCHRRHWSDKQHNYYQPLPDDDGDGDVDGGDGDTVLNCAGVLGVGYDDDGDGDGLTNNQITDNFPLKQFHGPMNSSPPQLFRHSKGLWLFRCVFKSKINIQFTLFQNFCCTMVDEQNSKDDDWCSQYLFQNFSTCCTMVEDGFCPLLSNDRVSCGASRNNLWKQFCCNKIFEATTNCTLFQSATSGSF